MRPLLTLFTPFFILLLMPATAFAHASHLEGGTLTHHAEHINGLLVTILIVVAATYAGYSKNIALRKVKIKK